MPDSNVDSINPFFSTSLFGLEKYFGDLFKLYKIRKLPKVVLLSGDKGSGKFTLSFHLINLYCLISEPFIQDSCEKIRNNFGWRNKKRNTCS